MGEVPGSCLIIDFDKPGSPLSSNERRCDYLLVIEDWKRGNWVVPLEFKRGRLDASQVIGQLQAGASAAEKIVPKDNSTHLCPVAVHRGISKHEHNSLRNKGEIRFHEHTERVRLMPCGDSLDDTLKVG